MFSHMFRRPLPCVHFLMSYQCRNIREYFPAGIAEVGFLTHVGSHMDCLVPATVETLHAFSTRVTFVGLFICESNMVTSQNLLL